MANQLTERVGHTGRALTLLALSAASLVLFVVTVTGVGVVLVSVGLLLLMVCLPLVRRLAGWYRGWSSRQLRSAPIPSPYRPAPQGNALVRLWSTARDPATRRDVLWLLVNSSVGLALAIVAVVESLLALVFWWIPGRLALDLIARISRALLTPSPNAALAERVEQLTASRAVAVDSNAAEIRRIERDLHDGAQARLVALGMSLGMAENAVDADPDNAKQLLAEARTATTAALAELRGLVRGIHPPVLADRGLVGAVQALVLSGPFPVEVLADVPGRLPAPVESAAYFSVVEVLTNAIKHSGASSARIELLHRGNLLRMRVHDDGRGGADPARGTGLRGIEHRLAAFDGRLVVISPPGGPTDVYLELPCVSSSPRILPSSGTG